MPPHKKPKAPARPERSDDDAVPPQPAPPPNNPFLAAREALQALVPKPKPAPAAPKPSGKPGKAPYPPRPAPAPPRISDEDLFRLEMSGVRPIRSADLAPKAPSTKLPPPKPSEEAEVYAQLADLVDGTGPWDIADTDEYIEGIGPGLDHRLLSRLRKGDFSLQGHLDLHGLTSEQAYERVERYVHQARLDSKRCVLIIHGRGINSKDQIPVLKERLRVWLTRGRIAKTVLCFCTARPVDGGAGAVYVLLRR